MIGKTKNFFSEVRTELQKASWPWDPKEKGFRRYKELYDSTLVVIISMVLLVISVFAILLSVERPRSEREKACRRTHPSS